MTHSRGKGQQEARPGTDIAYEEAHWRRDKAPAQGQLCPDEESAPDGIIDLSTSSSSSTRAESVSSSKGVQQALVSMADIASCSYEARKVNLP